MSTTRRTFFNLSAAALCLPASKGWALAKPDFWNQKDPSQWSDAERERILTNSPWARKASITFERGNGDGLSDGGGGPMGGGGRGGPPMGGDMGGMGGGGRGAPPMGGGDMGGGGRSGPPGGGEGEGGPPKLDVTVRWESSAPIRAALNAGAPAEADAYVLSVIGMPAMGMAGRGGMAPGMGAPPDGAQPNVQRQPPNDEDTLARYQQTSQIEVKGQPPLHPRKVERQDSPAGQRIVFHFDRSELPITAASKEVTFTMHMGPMVLKAKFTVKDMAYKEQLAL